MSTKKTQHLELHAWEETDDFLREEFNENFSKIDAKLSEKGRVVAGTYVGNGSGQQTISLGFTPQAVLVTPDTPTAWDITQAGLAVSDFPAKAKSGNGTTGTLVTIVSGGFRVHISGYGYTNTNGQRYHYMAVG